MKLVLASTSPYRRELLERLRLPFVTAKPQTDETPLNHETPLALAQRLAAAKARAVAGEFPHAIIIGSDQVACNAQNQIFGKPGNRDNAIAQLQQMRGQSITFHTAVALFNSNSGHLRSMSVPTEVQFRDLQDDEIVRYVEREQPYDCAGSAKSEALGITLLSALSGNDPTALIGLPLIAVSELLRQEGFQLP